MHLRPFILLGICLALIFKVKQIAQKVRAGEISKVFSRSAIPRAEVLPNRYRLTLQDTTDFTKDISGIVNTRFVCSNGSRPPKLFKKRAQEVSPWHDRRDHSKQSANCACSFLWRGTWGSASEQLGVKCRKSYDFEICAR
jgi:hypothetical protein